MRNKKYGINSITDAFLALNDILDEEIKVNNLKEKSKLKEAASVDLNNIDQVEKAQEFRKADEKSEDDELEVIDVDADSLNELKDSGSYIGKILLQCNSCKATKFVDVDKLQQNENDPELYNTEDECPHCHNTGTGYALIGQVGKKTDEPTLDNDTNNGEEAMFDNTNDVEPQAEETPTEETSDNEDTEENNGESSYDETNASDDTDELNLPELGDEFDVDDVMEDDTEEESDDEDKKKVKKESLNEDANQNAKAKYNKILSLLDKANIEYDEDDDPDQVFDDECIELVKIDGEDALGLFKAKINGKTVYDVYAGEELLPVGKKSAEEVFNLITNKKYESLNESNNEPDDDDEYEDDDNEADYAEDDIHLATSDYAAGQWYEGLDEKLDMATFEGSIANLIDTFTIEDNPVNIKLLNKNGSELGMYGSDDLPFNVKSQMMDTFNTDDNYLEVNVTENGDGTTVNDLFNYYRPDEDNQTTFVVTNVDTDEEEDFDDLTEFLEKYGDYYIDGALGLRTLNIYIADGDLETEVEPLDDEEIKELGKENAEKEEAEVTEESLIEEIINSYPGLKLNRINNSLSEEYFIADSIRLNEDIDLVYKNFVKPTNNEKLIEHFKSYTGYEDEVDKFLKEHNISKEKYNKIINEEAELITLFVYDKNDKELTRIGSDAKEALDYLKKNKDASYITYTTNSNGSERDYAFKNTDGTIKIHTYINSKDEYDYVDKLNKNVEKVNEKLLTSVKTRAELGEAINKLVEAKEKYRIAKSLTEGYRYDIFVNEDCKLDESKIPDITYNEAKKYFGKDYIGIESLGDKHIGIIYHDNRLGDDDYENEQETEYAIDDEGHILNILDGTRLVEGLDEKLADSNNCIVKATFEGKYNNDFYVKDLNNTHDTRDIPLTFYIRELDKDFTFTIYKEDAYKFTEQEALKIKDRINTFKDNGLVNVTIEDYNSNGNIKEGLFDSDKADEIEVLDDGDAEEVDTELVDQTPSTEVNEPVETTDIVPDDMRPEDIEIVEKIDRIATDIIGAIQEAYGVDVSDKKNLIVADIIQDLQLIGGEKAVEDLENTPINELTKQMYQEFNGFYDAMDELVSFFTGEEITTSQADRLAEAIKSLDSKTFSTDVIYQQIASPRFLQAAESGAIPYIDPTLLQAPTNESLRTFDEDYNTEDRLAELKKIQKERKLTDDEAEELAYCENEVDSRHAEQNYLNGINEDIELNDDNTSDEDCEQRLGELLYLQDQRELTDEEKEELEYCQQRVANKLDELDLDRTNESNEINLEEFDNCINEYLEDNEDDLLAYKSSKLEKVNEQLIINGLLESNNGNKEIQFTLTKVLNEDNNETNKYIVKNNLNDSEFNLEM